MSNGDKTKDKAEKSRDFLREEIDQDLANGRYDKVITRFPPEPNAYLTIGNAKAICINFGIAEEFGGQCNLRFDDTNPSKEEQVYIDAIQADIDWLGQRRPGQSGPKRVAWPASIRAVWLVNFTIHPLHSRGQTSVGFT